MARITSWSWKELMIWVLNGCACHESQLKFVEHVGRRRVSLLFAPPSGLCCLSWNQKGHLHVKRWQCHLFHSQNHQFICHITPGTPGVWLMCKSWFMRPEFPVEVAGLDEMDYLVVPESPKSMAKSGHTLQAPAVWSWPRISGTSITRIWSCFSSMHHSRWRSSGRRWIGQVQVAKGSPRPAKFEGTSHRPYTRLPPFLASRRGSGKAHWINWLDIGPTSRLGSECQWCIWCCQIFQLKSMSMLLVSRQTTQDDDVIVFLDAFDVFPNGLDGHVRKPGGNLCPMWRWRLWGSHLVAEMKWIHPWIQGIL